MKIHNVVFAVVCVLVGFLAAQAQGRPCSCTDKKDLLNLLNITEMAIQEYKFQISLIIAKETADGRAADFSPAGFAKLRETVTNALNAVRNDGLKNSPDTRDTTDCSVKGLDGQSNCMQHVRRAFHEVHQKVCLASKNWREPDQSYLERMELKQIALEEIAAYTAMQKEILKMLSSLPPDCRPKDWFGYVVYQKVSVSETTAKTAPRGQNYPRPGAGVVISNGRNDNSTYKNSYIGTIYVEDGKMSSAKAYAATSLNAGTIETGRVYCSAQKPDEAFVVTTATNNFAEGEQTGNASFNLNVYPAKASFSLSMSFFPVRMTGEMSSIRNNNSCNNKPVNNKVPLNTLQSDSGYRLDEKFNSSSPDYLEGSKIDKPALQQITQQTETGSAVQTYEITTRWMLRRLAK